MDSRTRYTLEVVEELRKVYKRQVYRTVIRENVRLTEAFSFTQPITAYDTRSTGAKDYRALAAELIKQEEP